MNLLWRMRRWLVAGWVLPVVLAAAGARGGGDVIINEIMYHPPGELNDLQYLELFNRGTATANLAEWSFRKGIRFVFPADTTLAPGSFLVVCRNRRAFAKHYGTEPAALGDFEGNLSHRGERIELADARGQLVDEVKYADGELWPAGPDGYSASLERICPFQSGQAPENWAGSLLPDLERPAGTPGRTNDNFSANLPPVIAPVEFKAPSPGREMEITAEVADADGVKSVQVFYQILRPRERSAEMETPMRRTAGTAAQGQFQGAIPAQPEGVLVRFRIKAVDETGAVRFQPPPNEPRPTYSCSTFVNTNTAHIPFAFVVTEAAGPQSARRRSREAPQNARASSDEPPRGNSAFIYLPPAGGEVLTFDYVHTRPRRGGFKVHFQKDRPLRGMTGINLIFEHSPRWVLAESLAYELYRMAGVPAPLSGHLRVWYDGRPLGYQLLVEQPNKAFLARNQRADDGGLYKVIWQGHGLVGQHEKKTQVATGHKDLLALHSGLTQARGEAQWAFIQDHFSVEEFASYYAVNMCIQNWDGFFNNHYLYHDTGGTGKWEVYPWDEDKTWGYFDGAARPYKWYEMPLTYGMNGDRSRNGVWWRSPGWFSGPLLANPQFRARFLDRLEAICADRFILDKFGPVIDALEQTMEPEISVRAQGSGEAPARALKIFHEDIQSFRNQVKHRREYILDELPAERRALGRAGTEAQAGGPDRGRRHSEGTLAWQFLRIWLVCAAVGVISVGVVGFCRLRRRASIPPPVPKMPPPIPKF